MHIDRVIVGNKVDGMMHAVDIWVHYVKNASKKIKVPYHAYKVHGYQSNRLFLFVGNCLNLRELSLYEIEIVMQT